MCVCTEMQVGMNCQRRKQTRPLEAAQTRKVSNHSLEFFQKLLGKATPFSQNAYGGVGRALGIPQSQIPQ